MFKSLRWRLQVWHAIVLLVVLASFGGIVHGLQWQTRLQQVDAELDETVDNVVSQWRRLLPPGRRLRRADEMKSDGTAAPPQDPIATALPTSTGQPRGNVEKDQPAADAGSNLSPQGTVPPERARRERPDPGPLPEEFQQLFLGDEQSRRYFIIWNGHGELLKKSESAPAVIFPNLHVGADGLPVHVARSRPEGQMYREVIHVGSLDVNWLVGRSLEKEITAYHRSGLFLAIMGIVILAAGVLGGGWLTSKAIRPITAMTTAAESISEFNLSERINIKETDSELGKLATVLNQTFDRLQDAFERQRQFTADASHELRTPLSVISTHTELALSRPRSPEDYREALETCQRASRRMQTLIDALLVMARFDSGMSILKNDCIDLAPLVRECADLLAPLAVERRIRVECRGTSCLTRGDSERLSQLVTNLIANAIRYNVDDGSVCVTTRSEGTSAVISVIDSGIGIADDELPRIFDRFYQVDQARYPFEGSNGLGLSICKTIVEAHHGTISVTSRLKVGTTVEVRLPLATETDPIRETATCRVRLSESSADVRGLASSRLAN